MRIGILAGAFNPPHAGHLHICRRGRKLLELDEVRWSVTPRHPTKPKLRYRARLAAAEAFTASHRRWLKLDRTEEKIKGTNYAYLTLEALRVANPKAELVFLAGYDALLGLCGWREWKRALSAMPWAVFPRGDDAPPPPPLRPYERSWRELFAVPLPCWGLMPTSKHPAASSAL